MRSPKPTPLLALALAALAGCDGDPADPEPEPTALCGEGVALALDGADWCAHHDVARFTCPEALPHRGVYQGVAFCGAAPADADAAFRVARAALRTGEVLEQRHILAFDVPDHWQTAPGAPSDSPLDLSALTWVASNTSWATNDGDPFLCTRQFERFEIEPASDGRLRITAWDRLTCGPEQIGVGVEEERPYPLTLPMLEPGRYTLAGPDHDADHTAPLVVDYGALCGDPRPLGECFRGGLFADCADGAAPPALWCNPEVGDRCLWMDCPPADWRARDCGDAAYCPSPHVSIGPDPWTRDRAMALAVEVDPALAIEEPTVACMADSGDVQAVCGPGDAEWSIESSPTADDGDWGWPSMLNFTAWAVSNELGEVWSLAVEVDLFGDAPRARACLIQTSDGGADAPPACAARGTVTLDRVPESAEEAAAVRATVRAEFADVDLASACSVPCAVQGLVIDARL